MYFMLQKLMFSPLNTSDATVLKQGRFNIYLASVYLSFNSLTLYPTSELMKLVEEAQRKNKKIVIGCDANSHHVAWDSTNTNRRGQALIDFLNTKDFITLNIGNKSTFVNRIREEVFDITICSEELINEIQDWRVSDEHFFSDLRYGTVHLI
ncbi:hypothetical protein FF38_01853 [Lucilia cuprina]|uniref:Endonuclease/exonuclease/phosphatase domain-containing protein n=1 Tax=Lucilia cuprina TaxID=7375 RepID=A0A0L0BSH1_LUCCU|nr:hypothetical protein FF38_01853 [Lucilia cuprina]